MEKLNLNDLDKILDKLLNLYKDNKLELRVGDFSIKLSSKKEEILNINQSKMNYSFVISDDTSTNITDSDISNYTRKINEEEKDNLDSEYLKGKVVVAPISGNFYTKVGDNELITVNRYVKKGDVVCFIEAMKVMNEVNSEYEGVVKKIVPKNGDFVKEGDSLIILE